MIAGRHDMSTPVAAGEFIRSQIPGAAMTILDAAHISNVEQPHAFTDAVVGFLTQRNSTVIARSEATSNPAIGFSRTEDWIASSLAPSQ